MTEKTYTLIGADGKSYRSDLPGTLGGYMRNRIYGRLDCPSALRAIARGGYVGQRVFFRDEQAAVGAGFRPCAVCMPEEYARWKEESEQESGLHTMGGNINLQKKSEEMNPQEKLDYARVAQAIEYIRTNFKSQPALEEIAAAISLSPAHFQRLFTAWAGVSPKKFLQYVSIGYAKKVLKESTLSDAAYETGLSGTSRLHDLFVNIEGMTPGEYKNGGESLSINYSFVESPFGNMIVASTPKGICHMAFGDDPAAAFSTLQERFPNARYSQMVDGIQQNALFIFTQDWSRLGEIKLHLKGTDFQLKVWETLLKIPAGRLTTYGDIALKSNNPNASRAVGTAIGDNPVAFLIPCHRVIRSSGELGGYHWGLARKAAIIGWEAARNTATE